MSAATRPRAVPPQVIGSGMISPADSFVFPATGQLTGLSFRFLWDVFQAANSERESINTINANIATLQNQMAAASAGIGVLQSQMATANANIATLQGQMATMEGQLAQLQTDLANNTNNLQGQINTVNARLAAAGIP